MEFSEKALQKLNELIKRKKFVKIEYIDSTNAMLLFKNSYCILSSDGEIKWHSIDGEIKWHSIESSVRFIFIDEENIGLKKVDEINALPSDKVYVYSNNDAVKKTCKKHGFQCISGYPTGNNQADFFIIANLVRTIENLASSYRKQCIFKLYSKDKALIQAFYFCCKTYGVRGIPMPKPKPQMMPEPEQKIIPNPRVNSKPVKLNSIKNKVFNALKRPKKFIDLRDDLKLPLPDLSRAMNELISENKIIKISRKKRNWIQASNINHVRLL